MAKKDTYGDWLKQDLGGLIDALDLSDLQRHFLRSRWLEQVVWMEGKAVNAQKWHYTLRLITIIGGVIIPALVSLNLADTAGLVVHWSTIVLGLAIAISTTIEGFFHYGDRWRHYRQTVEWLKIEGWRFFQLGDPYRKHRTHAEAYPDFADRVEDIIRRDVNVYISEVTRSKEDKEDKSEPQ